MGEHHRPGNILISLAALAEKPQAFNWVGFNSLKTGASRVAWRRNGLEFVGKGASDGGSVDVDFGDDTLYGSYTRYKLDSPKDVSKC